MKMEQLRKYYEGKRILLTGHTGFKGSWLSLILTMLGAKVYGYALEAPTEPSLFSILGLSESMHSELGDVRDYAHLLSYFKETEPELVFHLAAQPIVRESYLYPRETYESNVMGTVNLLECIRQTNSVRSVLNVTTDKVYENLDNSNHAFQEDEKLDGFDPYSNSKSCSELVTHSYIKSFFDVRSDLTGELPRISTARAGNVIGGGDFASDRIIPDAVRYSMKGEAIQVRNPNSTRPYQHVLEPLSVYLEIVMRQAGFSMETMELDRAGGISYQGFYNVGPDEEDAITTGELCDLFVSSWGDTALWKSAAEKNAPHEANYLKLDCRKLKDTFSWKPRFHVQEAVKETVKWYKAWSQGEDMRAFTEKQIEEFFV